MQIDARLANRLLYSEMWRFRDHILDFEKFKNSTGTGCDCIKLALKIKMLIGIVEQDKLNFEL